MRCYVTHSNIIITINAYKDVIPKFTANKCWPSYKVCLCFIVLSVIVCTVGYVTV